MNKGIIALLILVLSAMAGGAQTVIDKTIAVQPGFEIDMHFDYPKIIRLTTWDKSEISIHGTVSINSGENDDAFEIKTSSKGNIVSISNEIRDMKNLPHRITIVDGSQTIVFKDKAELRKYQDEHGKSKFERMSWGVDIDIVLEIKVPRNLSTHIESVYGLVEVTKFAGPLTVVATYGGVDASLAEQATGQIVAETNFGEIFTNLDTKFGGDQNKNKDFHTYVQAKPGSGPHYSFESKYGNVYIRKANTP